MQPRGDPSPSRGLRAGCPSRLPLEGGLRLNVPGGTLGGNCQEQSQHAPAPAVVCIAVRDEPQPSFSQGCALADPRSDDDPPG